MGGGVGGGEGKGGRGGGVLPFLLFFQQTGGGGWGLRKRINMNFKTLVLHWGKDNNCRRTNEPEGKRRGSTGRNQPWV